MLVKLWVVSFYPFMNTSIHSSMHASEADWAVEQYAC